MSNVLLNNHFENKERGILTPKQETFSSLLAEVSDLENCWHPPTKQEETGNCKKRDAMKRTVQDEARGRRGIAKERRRGVRTGEKGEESE
eukprot:397977-Hanusia_phi.AAC.3